jgi:hypothetical protein
MPRSTPLKNGRSIDATEAVKRMDKAIKRQTGARPEPYTPAPEQQRKTEACTREENVAIETARQGIQTSDRRPSPSKRPRRRSVLH